MTIAKALEVLKYHQAWRRGFEENYKYQASDVTEALNIAIQHLQWRENNKELFGTVSTTNDDKLNYDKGK